MAAPRAARLRQAGLAVEFQDFLTITRRAALDCARARVVKFRPGAHVQRGWAMILHNARMLLACAVFVTFATAAYADDCKLGRIASFDFTENGSIVVPVSIEGTSVRMAIDTGAPLSAIDPNVAHNLKLVQHRIIQGAMFNMSGEPISYIAVLRDLGLGDMHASNVELMVWPSPMTSDGRIGGILAADLLRHYDVDVDFGWHKLSLFSQDHCPGRVVYWTSDNVAVVPVHVVNSGHVIVPVKLDGQPFDAVLDTGSSTSFLSQEAAYRTYHLAPNSPDVVKVSESGGPGGLPLYRHAFKHLELEGLSIGNPTIAIFENVAKVHTPAHLGSRIPDTDESGGSTDFILGLSELRHLHLYIAYKEQNLYISPASAPHAAVTGNGSGPATTSAPASATAH
jgi:predicted aspartyl protease